MASHAEMAYKDVKGPARANILGIGISAINMEDAVNACDELVASGGGGYVCVTGVHGVMEARRNRRLREILNRSFLNVPDGMPTVWVGRLQRHQNIRRVYGPELMLTFCKATASKGYRHFLYGGNPGVAERLATALKDQVPGLQIAGTYTPPFRPLTQAEEKDLTEKLLASHADVLWVGLSTPKQEQFMAQYLGRLTVKLMVGVGAAFDIHTGGIKDAPQWVKSAGLQWLHRLCHEPRRLWKRYFIIVPAFLFHIALQFIGIERYSLNS